MLSRLQSVVERRKNQQQTNNCKRQKKKRKKRVGAESLGHPVTMTAIHLLYPTLGDWLNMLTGRLARLYCIRKYQGSANTPVPGYDWSPSKFPFPPALSTSYRGAGPLGNKTPGRVEWQPQRQQRATARVGGSTVRLKAYRARDSSFASSYFPISI